MEPPGAERTERAESPPQRNSNCECGLCPRPEPRGDTLSDLQRSVARCNCDACSTNGDILGHYRHCPNENRDSGIVYCDVCEKQKISVSNFRALRIANRLRLENGAGSDEDLCRRIDLSMDLEEGYDSRRRHNGHGADTASVGIDLSQFCQCELEKRKTSSVDEIFKMVDEGRDGLPQVEEEVKVGLRQRSLSDSQRDKAKVDGEGKLMPLLYHVE